jgi:hypothetical protein
MVVSKTVEGKEITVEEIVPRQMDIVPMVMSVTIPSMLISICTSQPITSWLIQVDPSFINLFLTTSCLCVANGIVIFLLSMIILGGAGAIILKGLEQPYLLVLCYEIGSYTRVLKSGYGDKDTKEVCKDIQKLEGEIIETDKRNREESEKKLENEEYLKRIVARCK